MATILDFLAVVLTTSDSRLDWELMLLRIWAMLAIFLTGHSLAQGVPEKALTEAKSYLEKNKKDFANQKFLSVIDYSLPSNAKRFFLIDLNSGKVEAFLVAHGKGSDPKFTGIATKFGDKEKSLMTSLGFFKTGDTYRGKHGFSLKLKGLSSSNQNAEKRAIVIHGANYVDNKRKILGRSWGCPALASPDAKHVIDKIKGGSLLYSWTKP